MSRFKKCPQGHTYKADLEECPICKSGKNMVTPKTQGEETQIIPSLDGETFGSKTTTDDEPVQVETTEIDPRKDFSKTMVEEEIQEEDETGAVVNRKETRSASRLVGWLVTYTHDPNGVDFRLYEGRNFIGKDFKCGVCINDPKVSSQHALLLFRNDKFRLKDELSTNGTFVNGEFIDDDSVVLHDGDIIQVGDTIFLFRTAFELPK